MSVLKIHLTYRCSAECDHCHLFATHSARDVLSLDLALSVIRDLKRLNDLQLVVLLGGEPGLVPELTHTLVREIRALGLGARVETNASWATSEEAARAFLEPLYAVDTEVMLSVDAFHEPFIPLGNLERAIRVSESLGVNFNLEVPYLDYPGERHPLDQRTNALLAELVRRLGHAPAHICTGPIFFKGRAAHTLAPAIAEQRRGGIPTECCDTVPWWLDGSQQTLQLLGLDPYGNLNKECGIVIGNATRHSVEAILRGFDAVKHPILSELIRSGPLGLARLALAEGYPMREHYADKCHLCQEAREALRKKYPDLLQPGQQYGEVDRR
jgi:hypothetical protein